MSATNGTVATLVIDFNRVPDGEILMAELDEERNGGRTTFAPGDVVYFRVWSSIPYAVAVSAGSVFREVQGETSHAEEVIAFPHTAEASVQRPIDSLDSSAVWYGPSLGPLTAPGGTKVRATNGGPDKIGVCKCGYTHKYDVWRLQPPSIPQNVNEFHVLVVVFANV